MKNYVILSVARGHNGSATLMVDGEIIWYIEEERLSRRKYDGSPLMAMQKAMEFVDHIDELIVCHTHRHGASLDWTCEDMYQGWLRKVSRSKFQPKVTFIDTIHHQMHATTAFINSGFESAAILVADGAGSFLKTTEEICPDTCFEFETIFKAKKPLILEQVYKHLGTDKSVGFNVVDEDTGMHVTEHPGIVKAYEAVTRYCGFQSIDAGKLMGLSPYGKPNSNLPPIVRDGFVNRDLFMPNYPNGAYIICDRYPGVFSVEEETAQRGKQNGEYSENQKDLAYAVQEASEIYIGDLIQKAVDITGEKNIVVSGGYGLNCVANYKYAKRFPDLNIYCEPVSHDGGTSIGAAKKLYYELEQTHPPKQELIYYGPQYDPSSYEEVIKDLDTSDTSYDDVAKLIRDGNIVTIFQGRSEGGPRALGNRSILFDPTIKNGKDLVNEVKHREFFRPFACSIKKDKANEWFDLAGMEESPFMMYAVDALDGVEEKIPSVIHVDGTCRIQTVTSEQNEHYYNLIDAFEKLSEVPILFNTSFNLGGEPLVETVEDAVDTLQNSDIDYLYLPEIQKLVHIPDNLSEGGKKQRIRFRQFNRSTETLSSESEDIENIKLEDIESQLEIT